MSRHTLLGRRIPKAPPVWYPGCRRLLEFSEGEDDATTPTPPPTPASSSDGDWLPTPAPMPTPTTPATPADTAATTYSSAMALWQQRLTKLSAQW